MVHGWLETAWQGVRDGGIVMAPIFLVSVVAWTLIARGLFRIRSLRRRWRGVIKAARAGDRDEARRLCAENGTGLARLLAERLQQHLLRKSP